MGSGASAFPVRWLVVVDDNLSATEVLAVLGVVVWASGLVLLVVSDILRSRSKHGDHHRRHGREADSSRHSQLRPR